MQNLTFEYLCGRFIIARTCSAKMCSILPDMELRNMSESNNVLVIDAVNL